MTAYDAEQWSDLFVVAAGASAALAALIGGVLNAWVLLVEILR